MKKKTEGIGLFYTRDSGGNHETTPVQYVKWGQQEAKKLKVKFSCTPRQIERMIRDGKSVDGDLYLDFGVSGEKLSRPGFNALIKRAVKDTTVTHIFVPRRDRIARPQDPTDGIKIENLLREAGKTIVFKDKVIPPLHRGKRRDMGELIVALIDYDKSGESSRILAQQMIDAQLTLASLGFSTGGRPPYGFRRWLVREDGTAVRQLEEGEYVKRARHHVVWLPGPEAELEVIREILSMLKTIPATQVAIELTARGIPSPDAGRTRKDNGVIHEVSGLWHATTITNIARNKLLSAITTYGARSMGRELRFTPEGPRELKDADFREDGKPKVIRNPVESQVTAKAHFDPIIDPKDHEALIVILNKRAGSQRGKPRSRDPRRNPLGGRVYDMNCFWLMYREPYNGSFRYKCGLYQQSSGTKCAHNHVDGIKATQFGLSVLRQRILNPKTLLKLKLRLKQLANDACDVKIDQKAIHTKKRQIVDIEREQDTINKNLARAKNDEQYDAISKEFDQLGQQKSILESELEALESQNTKPTDADTQVEMAMNSIQQLTQLVETNTQLEAARDIFELANLRLFLKFEAVQPKKRIINKVVGGVVTIGLAPAPIEIYQGPTGRGKLKKSLPTSGSDQVACNPRSQPEPSGSGREEKSLGNVSRDDRI